MTKEEIIAFRENHKIIFTNERVELVLTNNQKLVGFFDAQEPNSRNSNQWKFTTLSDKKEHVVKGEDILNINLYRFGTNTDEDGDDYVYKNGEFIKTN